MLTMIPGRVGFYTDKNILVPNLGHAFRFLSIIAAWKTIVSDNPLMKSVKIEVHQYPHLQWYWYVLQDMAPEILYDLLALREAIFVVEQTCIYHELDGLDKIAQHLLLKHDDEQAVAKARQDFPSSGVFLDAQTYLQGFYLSLGFETCGDEFLEDGIPHIPMQLPD
jgi:ElaA protein